MTYKKRPQCYSSTLPIKSHISPSAIKGSPDDHCLIPAVFRRASKLKFGHTPSTFMGTCFHELIELAGQGIDPKKKIKELKTEALKGVPVQRLFAADDDRNWQKRKRPFLALAKEAFDKYDPHTQPTPATLPSSGSTKGPIPYQSYAKALRKGTHHEQEMAFMFNGVWLYGIIDHLEVKAKEIIITGFKTGRMIDHEGKTKESYRIQMLVYGFIAAQLYKNRKITLLLKGASLNGEPETIAIPFSAQSAKTLVSPIVDAYQAYKTTPQYRPGEDCRWCSLRIDCPAYHDQVQEKKWWLLESDNDFSIPLDIWGVISAKTTSGRSGYCHLQIQTDVGPFTIKYIPEESIREKNVGSFIEIYSMFNPNGTQFTKHLPRSLTIGPLNATTKPWNQSFSYIII